MRGLLIALAAGTLACAPAVQATAQKNQHVVALRTAPLAGQPIPVLPFAMVVADTGTPPDLLPADRAARLRWADSLLAEVLLDRGPEVQWMLPDTLRRIARRNAPLVANPDALGTPILRAPNLKTVPDPLRSNLRSLVAVAGGRFAFVPAALLFEASPDGGVRATFVGVMADVRNGTIVWRTTAPGLGATPAQAATAAFATVLPLDN